MNEPLNTNTRILRVSPDGFSVASGEVCGSCGVRDLCKPTQAPKVCGDFSPLFAFRSPLIGFGEKPGDFFNTFRLGNSMFNRFSTKVGTTVTLLDKRKMRTMGYAHITGLATGTMEDMLKKYAHTNHLSIGRGIKPGEAPGFLKAVLLKNYHTMFKVEDRDKQPFSVIFMSRCEAPVFKKREAA